ncbi:uncharacterized protein LOC141802527 [Halichoeres trimaculatus]|uniref:uncharacterized protein LOC141802527 n=1 Tax=Halichoeres trimaculatus TaxID=147232 RepID=UPI003D9EBDCE
MKPLTLRTWFLRCLPFFLDGGLVDSSSLASIRPLPVSCDVGHDVVLPCSWKPRLGEVDLPACHVQWMNPSETVYERLGEQKFEAEGFEGRVEVPEDKLGSGDCSLTIRDVQIMDTGRYESFMVVEGVRETHTKVFIQSVRLSVKDHESHQVHAPGEELVLDLFTPRSKRVVFQGRNSSSWTVLWMREEGDNQRLEKDPQRERLTMRSLGRSDEGTYKVVDEHGLTVSTVQLTVKESSTPLKFQQDVDDRSPTGKAAKHSVSAFFLSSLLLLNFQMFHLS